MNRAERAKQFLPFDALKGLQDELKIREERLTCVEKAELTEEACERLSSILATLNKGDFVSVTGHVFVTKTGEKTIKVTQLTLLSKAIRPMPEKYHGLQDTEVRFRKRHLDLIANEDVKEIFVKRAKIIFVHPQNIGRKRLFGSRYPDFEPRFRRRDCPSV